MTKKSAADRGIIDASNCDEAIAVHVMADGSVRDNLKGYKVSWDKFPYAAREIIKKMFMDDRKPE